MAFSSIIDDMRRMNAKMIAMGQSIDIQKMPRPKKGINTYNNHATFVPEGSEIEKLLYPKNFRPQTYAEPKKDGTKIVSKRVTKSIIIGDTPLEEEVRIRDNENQVQLNEIEITKEKIQLNEIETNNKLIQLNGIEANTNSTQLNGIINNTNSIQLNEAEANTNSTQLNGIINNTNSIQLNEAEANTNSTQLNEIESTKNSIHLNGIEKKQVVNSWENCKYFKQNGNQSYCKEYLCFCAKEKCFKIKK